MYTLFQIYDLSLTFDLYLLMKFINNKLNIMLHGHTFYLSFIFYTCILCGKIKAKLQICQRYDLDIPLKINRLLDVWI